MKQPHELVLQNLVWKPFFAKVNSAQIPFGNSLQVRFQNDATGSQASEKPYNKRFSAVTISQEINTTIYKNILNKLSVEGSLNQVFFKFFCWWHNVTFQCRRSFYYSCGSNLIIQNWAYQWIMFSNSDANKQAVALLFKSKIYMIIWAGNLFLLKYWVIWGKIPNHSVVRPLT